jgi:hypothetical protein
MRPVTCSLKNAILILMVALVPLRAVAAVTVGFCAMSQHAPVQVDAATDHAASHEHDSALHPHGDANQDRCNACAEHCASASVVTSGEVPLPSPAGANRVARGEGFAAGFVPDHLDHPPLAL